MSRWRVAARLARRQVRHHWARSALVVVIIALPVLAAQAAAITWQSYRLFVEVDPLDWSDAAMGGADEQIGFDPRIGPAPTPGTVTRAETGFRIVDWTEARSGHGTGPDDLARVELVAHVAPGDDPARQPGSDLDLVAGTLPTSRRQVAISQVTADATGLGVGDTLTALASQVELEVTGVAREDGRAQSAAWVGPPVEGDDWVPDTVVRLRESGSPLVVAELFSLHWYAPGTGASLLPPAGYEPPPDALPRVERSDVEAAVVATAVTTMVIGFVAITCSSAFAIGARRQLRQLGTLAAAGAAPADLRRAVLLQGTVLGAIGAALATVLVYAGRSFVVRRLLDAGDGWILRNDPGQEWVVARAPGWVLGAALLGVLAGTLAALVPAVTASRIPVLSALAGRRPLRRRRARSPYVGAAALAGGLLLLSWSTAEIGTGSRGVFTVLAVLLTMGGAVALAPAVAAAVAGLAARAGRTPRLAGRSLVRNSMRTGAVVAATAVAIALPVVVVVGTAGQDAGSDEVPRAEREHVEAVEDASREVGQLAIDGDGPAREVAVGEVLDIVGSEVVTAHWVWTTRDGDSRHAFAVDPEELRRVAGDDLVADALADGAIVRTAMTFAHHPPGFPSTAIQHDPLDVSGRPVRTVEPDAVSPLTLLLLDQARGGLMAGPAPRVEAGRPAEPVWILRPGAFSPAEREDLYGISRHTAGPTVAALRDLSPAPERNGIQLDVGSAHPEQDPSLTPWFVLGAAVFALVVIGTAMALAAADGRGDDAVVAAVGAPPGTVRRRRALEATITAGAAGVLAVGVGVAATLAVLHNPGIDEYGSEGPVTVPVLDVLGTAGGIVAVVGLVTWSALAVSDRLRGRRDLALVDG